MERRRGSGGNQEGEMIESQKRGDDGGNGHSARTKVMMDESGEERRGAGHWRRGQERRGKERRKGGECRAGQSRAEEVISSP